MNELTYGENQTSHHQIGVMELFATGESPDPAPDMQRLHRRLEISAVENERLRIARDLHDDAGHRIYSVLAQLDLTAEKGRSSLLADEDFDLLRVQLRDCIDGLHEIASGLQPRLLRERGLYAAVSELAARASASTSVSIRVCGDRLVPPLDEGAELALFRFVQESLTNALKHSHATRIDISFLVSVDQICISIDDNGVGFNWKSLPQTDRIQMGLVGIRERVAIFGGAFNLISSMGEGTSISATFPASEVTK